MRLVSYGQIDTVVLSDEGKSGDKVINWGPLTKLFYDVVPTHVICEDYRVYQHKLERHAFSKVETLRLIGGIDMLCRDDYGGSKWSHNDGKIPIAYQMAAQAKGFITDDKLKRWDFWKTGMRHSRDAIRHGLYYLIITNRPK